MRWSEIDTQVCSVARSLSVIGDNWTLLILRDCFLGLNRFDQFQKSLGVTRHRLADRLSKLTKAGVLEKQPYQERPLRNEYRLTEMGKDLYPVMMFLARWGDQWLADEDGTPLKYRHQDCGKIVHPEMVCSDCGGTLNNRNVTPIVGPGIQEKLSRGDSSPSELIQAPALQSEQQ